MFHDVFRSKDFPFKDLFSFHYTLIYPSCFIKEAVVSLKFLVMIGYQSVVYF